MGTPHSHNPVLFKLLAWMRYRAKPPTTCPMRHTQNDFPVRVCVVPCSSRHRRCQETTPTPHPQRPTLRPPPTHSQPTPNPPPTKPPTHPPTLKGNQKAMFRTQTTTSTRTNRPPPPHHHSPLSAMRTTVVTSGITRVSSLVSIVVTYLA